MCTGKRPFLIVVLICLASMTSSQEPATKYTAWELIEKIIESENKIKDVQADYIFFQTDTNFPLIYAHWAYQAEKELIAGLNYEKAGSNLGYTISRKIIFSLNGKQRFSLFEEDMLRGRKGGLISIPNPSHYDSFNGYMAPNSLLGFDISCGTRRSFAQSLQQAQKVTLRKQTELLNGHNCYVLEAIGIENPSYIYDVRAWIDIDRDFRPLKVEIFYNTMFGGRKYQPFERLHRKVYDIKLRDIDGIWFPVEGKREFFSYEEVLPPELEGLTAEQAKKKYSEQELEKLIQKITRVSVPSQPARKALVDIDSIRINQGIKPDVFVIKPLNGCEVLDEIEDKRYTVENGEGTHFELEVSFLKLNHFAPPGLMKVIYPDTLIGCNLHDLAQFQINLEPEEIEGRPLLLFIWDFNQRPSRAKIIELVDKSRSLEEEGLVIIGVQASKIKEDELRQWTAANGVFFPIIIKQADELHTQLSMAARSLPWLILTDTDHIVTEEGFSINELDEKIQIIE